MTHPRFLFCKNLAHTILKSVPYESLHYSLVYDAEGKQMTVFLAMHHDAPGIIRKAEQLIHFLDIAGCELAADVAGKVTAAICAYYGGGAVSATSKLGELTIKDITGRVQAKLAKKGITDANCKDCDPAAIAKEVCEDCCADCTPTAQ